MKTTKVLTMADLESVFNQAIQVVANYIGIMTKYPHLTKPVITIYSNADFEYALDSYKAAYDKNLSYNSCDLVKIIGFEYGDSFAEIQDWLMQ